MENIKKETKKIFEENKCEEALNKLIQIEDIQEVVNYIERNNWFKNRKFCKYFFEVGLFELNIFDKILNVSGVAEKVFRHYFQSSSLFNEQLELALIDANCNLYIKLIRVNVAFFNEERLSFLEKLDESKDFELHRKVWLNMHQAESKMWSLLQKELKGLLEVSKLSVSEVFSYAVLWLEEKRWERKNDDSYINQLSKAYNLFVILLLNKNNRDWINKTIINEEIFEKSFQEIYINASKTKKVEENNVIRLLEYSLEWTIFRDSVIFPYCYNLQLFPEENTDAIYFNETPKGYYQWHLDNLRYENNQILYLEKGILIAREHVQYDNQVLGEGSIEDKGLNFELLIKYYALKETLESLGIKKAAVRSAEKDAFELIKPFLGYAFNRKKRHEETLLEFCRIGNFYDAYRMFVGNNHQYVDWPFIAMSTNEYFELLFESTENNELFERFYFDFDKVSSSFDRFNTLPYNVWEKPFNKIGDFLFSPMLFFANNDWFYASVQAVLNLKKKKEHENEETKKMEIYLKQQFETKANWQVIRPDDYKGELEGDADLIIKDNETVLLIQLKRTYFRLDFKEAYYEDITVNEKASKQLNKIEHTLKKENKTGFLLQQIPIKWIVTTSFEKIGDEFNGCKKVNYFDVLHALENEQIKTVKELVKYIEKDTFLQESLTLFSNKDYRKCFIQKNTTLYYDELLNYHSHLVAKKYINALVSCKELLTKYPNDPQLMYEQSFIYWELKQYRDALWTYMDLYESYPKISKVKEAIDYNINKCVNNKLLNENELESICKRWYELTEE